MEKTLDYYPPSCELERIANAIISACDPLDSKKDGMVARTDLCKLHFNVNSTIGLGFGKGKRQMGMGSSAPAINGTVSAKGAVVAQVIMESLHNSKGRRAYISYQPSSSFSDAETSYSSVTDSYELSIASTGGEWITRFLELRETDNLSTLDNVAYDSLRDWMELGWKRYEDVLQTTWADLSKCQSAGGKILTFHGESDQNIPTGSSAHFYESVRDIIYPNMKYNESTTSMGDWYSLFLVPVHRTALPMMSKRTVPSRRRTLLS